MNPEWILEFDQVNSIEEGMELVWRDSQLLDDAAAGALLKKGEDLRRSGDPDGAEEYVAWGREARSIVTRRDLLATDIRNAEDGMKRLVAARARFDDAFVELCVNVASGAWQSIQRLIEADQLDAAQAGIEQKKEHIEFELGFVTAIARVTEEERHRAESDFAWGCWMTMLGRLEKLRGGAGAEASEKAQTALQNCIENAAAPAEMKAKAEDNLATVAYPDMLQVNAHQEAALKWAEQSKDWHLARDLRRHRAYWAKQRKDWKTVYELSKKNVDAAESAVLAEWAPNLVIRLVRAARLDVERAVEACLELGEFERALEMAEWGKARTFLRASMLVAVSHRNVPERLLRRRERLEKLSEEIGIRFSLWGWDIAQKHTNEADLIYTRLGRTQSQLAKFVVRRAIDLRCYPIEFDEMVKLVPRSGVILSYFEYDDRIVVFALGERGLIGEPEVISASRADVARLMVQLQVVIAMRADFMNWEKVQRGIDTKIEAVWPHQYLAAFYRMLIGPVAARIRGCELAYVSPDALLWQLPFHAFLKDDHSAWVEEVALAYAPGLAGLRRALDQRASHEPVFAAGVNPILGGPNCSWDEADAVAAVYGVTRQDATLTAVLQSGIRAGIFHLSCHSNLGNATTIFQGLQLEDALLTSGEIIAAGCGASLALLAACETARADLHGDGEELGGLVGAFLQAGCASVVASMWKLAESASVEFAREFHSALRSSEGDGRPGPKARAMQTAMRALKKQPRWDHPYFWAPLCVYGAA